MMELIYSILRIPVPFNMIIVLVFLGVVGGSIKVIAVEVRKYFVRQMELDLKRDMVERGFSPAEIMQVMDGGTREK